MPHSMDAALREELRCAGLPSHGALPRLLTLLRDAPDTHLSVRQVAEIAADAGLAIARTDLARHLDTLADHGLLGRLPTTTGEQVFDTVTEPHAHLVYCGSSEVVDLHVSADTLLTIVRDALLAQPDGVEILVRLRRDPAAGVPLGSTE